MEKFRCPWCLKDQLYIDYHDHEWGRPVHDDEKLFEMLLLEGAQAGLSWHTILKRRETYRAAFDQFDARKIARYDARRKAVLLQDPGIIRNRLKVEAFVINARKFLEVQEEHGSFDEFIWQFTDHRVIDNPLASMAEYQATTPESDRMSKALKGRGFKFVGSTICYAFMQACGMVNDHLAACWVRQDG
ncbi:MAG: DNA-3-methyladenine glycosylase I [Saprospiraceae bacterium]|nr:DNA-3-methyladenine glycosylase I [Saprospiraceae bacterium]